MNASPARLHGRSMGRALLVLALAGAILFAILLSPARANHSFPATYTGSAATGGTVEFDVSADGGSVTRFALENVPTSCGTISSEATGNVAIVNHAFTQPSGALRYSGSFPATQQAQGTLSVQVFGFPSCTSDDVAWNATTTAPPPGGGEPPSPPPDDGQPPPGDDQPPPGDDTTPPDTTLSGKKTQRAGRAIRVGVSCHEACSAVGSGKIVVVGSNYSSFGANAAARRRQTLKLKRARTQVAAGDTEILKLKPKRRRANKKIRRLVNQGATAKAKVLVKTTDAAGNTDTERRMIKLR